MWSWIYIIHTSCGSLMYKTLWQVMYDATGVRLQAGRQAEVWCFCLNLFSFKSLLQFFSYSCVIWFIKELTSDMLCCLAATCFINILQIVQPHDILFEFWLILLYVLTVIGYCPGFESNCVRTSLWASSGWEQTTAWTSWPHTPSGSLYWTNLTL